jgi:hypothetical protein
VELPSPQTLHSCKFCRKLVLDLSDTLGTHTRAKALSLPDHVITFGQTAPAISPYVNLHSNPSYRLPPFPCLLFRSHSQIHLLSRTQNATPLLHPRIPCRHRAHLHHNSRILPLRGQKAFNTTPAFVESTKVLAGNQGLYNGLYNMPLSILSSAAVGSFDRLGREHRPALSTGPIDPREADTRNQKKLISRQTLLLYFLTTCSSFFVGFLLFSLEQGFC